MAAIDPSVSSAKAGANFTLLMPGWYPFTVLGYEWGQHAGSEKLGPCAKVTVTVQVDGTVQGTSDEKVTFFYDTDMLWKAGTFMKSLGFEKMENGEYPLDWEAAVGKMGWVRVDTRSWVGKDGVKRDGNDLKRFAPVDEVGHMGPDDEGAPAKAPQPSQSAQQATEAAVRSAVRNAHPDVPGYQRPRL